MNEYGKYNDEMSLEELEKITAGYPDLSALSDMKESEQLKETSEVTEEMFKTENEKLVEELPFGELSEEQLNNVIAGRLG